MFRMHDQACASLLADMSRCLAARGVIGGAIIGITTARNQVIGMRTNVEAVKATILRNQGRYSG
jgi:hypothetical protein